jgi:hypothetical protein
MGLKHSLILSALDSLSYVFNIFEHYLRHLQDRARTSFVWAQASAEEAGIDPQFAKLMQG